MNKTLSRTLVVVILASGLGAAWYYKSRSATPPAAPVVVEMVYELAPGDVMTLGNRPLTVGVPFTGSSERVSPHFLATPLVMEACETHSTGLVTRLRPKAPNIGR